MKKYNKGLLSLATVLALGSSLAANSYIPLTSNTNDYRWVMFGVNGFLTEGATTGTTRTFETGGGWNGDLTDTTYDEIAIEGWPAATGTGNMGSVKITDSSLSSIKLNIDLTGTVWNESEPVRSMYIDADGNGKASALITYKASLEGKTVEFQVGTSDDTYTFKLNFLNTFDDPQIRSDVKTVTGAGGGTPISAIDNIVDYNMNDNPRDPGDFVRSVDLDVGASENTRFYSYVPANNAWEIYDRDNSAAANDFTSLLKGKGYWGRIDTNANNAATMATGDNQAGLVLSTSSISAADYTAAGLEANAWNLISFNRDEADIKIASTGMILGRTGLNTGDLKIMDSSSNFQVTVPLDGNGTIKDCQVINLKVREAKAKGQIADTFDLVAIPESAASIVLMSNKKFYIADEANASLISSYSTIGNQFLWNDVTGATTSKTATLAAADGNLSSIYGEYSMIVEPVLNGVLQLEQNTTGSNSSGAIALNGNDPISLSGGGALITAATIDTQLTKFATGGTSATDVRGLYRDNTNATVNILDNITQLDMDMNGTADSILLVSNTKKFYVEDYTFTRKLSFASTGADATRKVSIKDGVADSTVLVSAGDTPANFISNINNEESTTGVYATNDGANLVAVSATAKTNGMDLYDDVTDDYIKAVASSSDVTKGAIGNVYSLGKLAKSDVKAFEYTVTFPLQQIDSADTNVSVYVNGIEGNVSTTTVASTDAARTVLWNATKKAFNDLFFTNGIDMVATHDYVSGDSNGSKFTLTGFNSLDANFSSTTYIFVDDDNESSGTDVNTTFDYSLGEGNTTLVESANAGKLSSLAGDLTEELVYRPVYSPDYPTDGPLYTLKALGFAPQAMITGNTDMTSDSVGWDSIDFTKDPKTWSDNKDFNLFTTDYKAGYWTYLENDPTPNGSTDIVVSNVRYTATYTHHMNTDDGTVGNHLVGNLNFDVAGLPTDTTPVRVIANVGGQKVECASVANDGSYSAQFSGNFVDSLASGKNHQVLINVSNGLGYSKTGVVISSLLNGVDTNVTLDVSAPVKPTVTYYASGVDVNISSTSTDIAKYHVYNQAIDEKSPATNNIGIVTPLEASNFSLATTLTDAFGTTVTARVVAVDGDGTLAGGNISPITDIKYEQMIKTSVKLENFTATGVTSVEGIYYDAAGQVDGNRTDSGVGLDSLITDKSISLMFAPIDGVTSDIGTAWWLYVDVNGDGTAEAAIQFQAAYAGKKFYIVVNGQTLKGQFPADATVNSTEALGMKAGSVAATELVLVTTGQTF